jgi:hypothetical protein
MFTSAQKEAILQKELCFQTGGKHKSSPSGGTLNKFFVHNKCNGNII